MTDPLFTHHLSVGITDDMDYRVEDLASIRTRQGQPVSKAQIIREAIRLYLDQQGDLVGSRKQIARSIEGKLEQLVAQVNVLEAKVTTLDTHVQAGQRDLNLFHRAMLPLLQWVEARRGQGTR